MGVGMGLMIAAAAVQSDKPIIHVSGDLAIGYQGRCLTRKSP